MTDSTQPFSVGETRRAGGGAAAAPTPESSPAYRRLRDLLDAGQYASAVRLAYRTAFEGTVRAYGLTVPVSCTDRQFLAKFLRPDMGRLVEILPELYRRYEPVRFGKVQEGDRDSLRGLLQRLYSQTALARMDDPLYQSRGPVSVVRPTPGPHAVSPPARKGGTS